MPNSSGQEGRGVAKKCDVYKQTNKQTGALGSVAAELPVEESCPGWVRQPFLAAATVAGNPKV